MIDAILAFAPGEYFEDSELSIEERLFFADLNVFKYTEWYLFYSSVTKASLNRDQGITPNNPLKNFFVIN
ncbi:hypothetical protein MJH12_18975, partial [bacterium]|nr:hypothetical protein [bacterium]